MAENFAGQNNNPEEMAAGDDPRMALGASTHFQQMSESLLTVMSQMSKTIKMSADDMGELVKVFEKAVKAGKGLSDTTKETRTHLADQHKIQTENVKQAEARIKSETRLNKLFKDNAVVNQQALQNELRHSKLAKGGRYYIPPQAGERVGRFVSPNEFAAAMKNPEIAASVKAQLKRQYEAEAFSGNENRFRIREFAHAAMSGDLGGAMSELMQGTRVSGKLGGGVERLAGRLEAGGRPGLAGVLSRFGVPAAEFLGGPAALLAGQQIFTRSMRQINDARQLGYETGDGAGAGFARRAQAFGQSLNPFDMLSFGDAMKIQQNLAGAGFRGSQAGGAAGIIGDMKNMGISIDAGSKLVITSLRDAGITMDETRMQMLSLRDSAKSAGSSLTDMTTAVTGAITELSTRSTAAAQGAQPSIGILSQQFARPGGQGVQVQPGMIAGLLQGTQRQTLGQLMGLAPWQVWSKAFSDPTVIAKAIDNILIGLAKNKPPGWDTQSYVAFFMMSPLYQQLFGATPYPQIAAMLDRVWKGTKQGTDVQGYLNRTSQLAMKNSLHALDIKTKHDVMNEINSKSAGGDFFSHPLRGLFTVHNPFGGGLSHKQVQAQGQSALTALRNAGMSAGVSYEDRKTAFAPLVAAIAGGHMGKIRQATAMAERQLEQDAKKNNNQNVTVQVGFTGEAGNVLREYRRSVQTGRESGSRSGN